ncbi:MAG: hypothetical protein LBJ36_01895, partial [Synergistaceae bacterium]|nr:hypothetical protein [Synergistaceae bacterium]
WQSLKLEEPQRRDERSSGAKVTKVEKIFEMAHEATLNALAMGLQQRSSEQGERSTTIPEGSRDKRPEKVSSLLIDL